MTIAWGDFTAQLPSEIWAFALMAIVMVTLLRS